MMDDLAQRLTGYAMIGVGREDGINQGEYAALLVKTDRFRIQKSGTFGSPTRRRSATPALGAIPSRASALRAKLYDRETKRTFHFFNTHLDHASGHGAAKGTELILSRIAERRASRPVILTGDFNASDEDPLHASIRTTGFTDVWKALNKDVPANESGTFHRFTGATDQSRIDFIYATPDLKGLESVIVRTSKNGNYPSDHFPVRATLDW